MTLITPIGGGIRSSTGQCEIISNLIVGNGTYGGMGGLLFDTVEGPQFVAKGRAERISGQLLLAYPHDAQPRQGNPAKPLSVCDVFRSSRRPQRHRAWSDYGERDRLCGIYCGALDCASRARQVQRLRTNAGRWHHAKFKRADEVFGLWRHRRGDHRSLRGGGAAIGFKSAASNFIQAELCAKRSENAIAWRMPHLTPPSETFKSSILIAYIDVVAEPLSEHYANTACKVLVDQIEWVYQFYENDPARLLAAKNLNEFRARIFEKCPDLRVMWDTADAAKHRFLTKPKNPPRLVTSSTAAYSIEEGQLMLAGRPALERISAAVEFWRAWRD